LYGDAWVLACLALCIGVCAWPLLVRSVSRRLRGALTIALVIALLVGVAHSECSSPREICLNEPCGTSLSAVECTPQYTGRVGRAVLAVRCASWRPIRLQPGKNCGG
jgi:hypothetical protein